MANRGKMDIEDMSLAELVALRVKEGDESFALFDLMFAKIEDANIGEISELILCGDDDCAADAIQILSDSRVTPGKIYHVIDKLFERNSLSCVRDALMLIVEERIEKPEAIKRISEFICHSDPAIRSLVNRWLLWTDADYLQSILDTWNIPCEDRVLLIQRLVDVKSQKVSLEEFLVAQKFIDVSIYNDFLEIQDYIIGACGNSKEG